MLAQLATVKDRLGILDSTHDALLTMALQAMSMRFDLETGRTLARTVDATFEFQGDETDLAVACYPIESVAGFEVMEFGAGIWVPQDEPGWLVRRGCVISLLTPLARSTEQARVIYTGGYVLPGFVPAAGQAALPKVVEAAAIEQVAFWFQNRDNLGVLKRWPQAGDYIQLQDTDLLPAVTAVLARFRRWVI